MFLCYHSQCFCVCKFVNFEVASRFFEISYTPVGFNSNQVHLRQGSAPTSVPYVIKGRVPFAVLMSRSDHRKQLVYPRSTIKMKYSGFSSTANYQTTVALFSEHKATRAGLSLQPCFLF
jgi:hypothetical protein